MSSPIVECVPNISEGQRPAVIEQLAAAVREVAGVRLLHQDPGYGAHRTVFTFAGRAEGVLEAAFQLFVVAAREIDMSKHRGTHPRMGAVDVCPFVPILNCDLEYCANMARQLGERVWTELGVPVYLYEAAASREDRRNLATVRRGEYEGLAAKMRAPEWRVDYGTEEWNPRFGTAIIGARPFLIAWNINLATDEIFLARIIAERLRGSGRWAPDPKTGKKYRIPGKFPGLKAIGWRIEEYGICQVSTNVVDPGRVPLADVYYACEQLAHDVGTTVTGSELIGLIPERYLRAVASPGLPRDTAIEQAVERLGLNDLEPFDWRQRVLEELLFKKP